MTMTNNHIASDKLCVTISLNYTEMQLVYKIP